MNEAITARAAALGLATSYWDVFGEQRHPSEESLARILDALGEAQAAGLLPRAVTLASDQPGVVALMHPLGQGAGWRVDTEFGAVHEGRIGADDTRIDLPALPAGYHRLRLDADGAPETTLITAPESAYLPPVLIGNGRATGISVQLYGLKSARNWGIGDFGDLATLARAAAPLGIDAIGLNPLHAGFAAHPEQISPYSPSNRRFLNWLYIDVEAVEGVRYETVQALIQSARFQADLSRAREAEFVDYPLVADLKRRALEAISAATPPSSDPGFAAFRAAHGSALERHAVFEALDAQFMDAEPRRWWWGEWPEDHRNPDSDAVRRFAEDQDARVTFHAWLQYLADRQLAAAHEAARNAGMAIGLYRDLAVGSARSGAEVWQAQDAFAAGLSIGAPSDLLAPGGQDWGLPPLNPRALADEAYRPFVELIRANMAHAGALRIDHVLGLARLFVMANGAGAETGTYVALPLDILLAILRIESHRARALVIGEDLGTVPEGFRETIARSGIFSYRLMMFETRPDGRPIPPAEYPALALAGAATHDLPTLAGWWAGRDLAIRHALRDVPEGERREHEQRGLARGLVAAALREAGLITDQPDAAPIEAVHRFLARAPSKLMILQIEDVLGLVDQANLPGTIDEHPNWRRRLPVVLEALIAADGPLAGAMGAVEAERPMPLARTPLPHVPRATCRLQLNKDFTFDDTSRIVPYLADLGISHLYVSPILKSRPGSTHGYDIIDHAALDPELGGGEGFDRLVRSLRAPGLGLIADIVPNHMGVGGSDNGWWLDVLRWGPLSPFARYFDIDWRERQGYGSGRLLIPILGSPYGEALTEGALRLVFDPVAGRFDMTYFQHLLPLSPPSWAPILHRIAGRLEASGSEGLAWRALAGDVEELASAAGDPAQADALPVESQALEHRLAELAAETRAQSAIGALIEAINQPGESSFRHALIEAQSWRPAWWRVATNEINYRRFFDINDLAGLRVEDPVLFDRTHGLILSLVHTGQLQGLRIDHIDGLADPGAYCARLRERVGPDLWIGVEKILAAGERLPDWPVAGTTGYDALNQLNALFVDPASQEPLKQLYRRLTGRQASFAEDLRAAKRLILDTSLASELRVLALDLKLLAERDWFSRDFTLPSLRAALAEIIARLPVYRTYVTQAGVREEDRALIEDAVARARRAADAPNRAVFDFIAGVLTLDLADAPGRSFEHADLLAIVTKFQQLSGPTMAKGVEDTAFYRHTVLLSLNEVGGDPRRFGATVEGFHEAMAERARLWPDAMTATTTHDTKRGEDARVRLDLLSDMPMVFARRMMRWRRLTAPLRREVDGRLVPSPAETFWIHQAILGAWPAELSTSEAPSAEALARLAERVQGFARKALREAKETSSWINPDESYEAAVAGFIADLLSERSTGYLDDLRDVLGTLIPLGLVQGLSQLVVKLAMPGVPDFYQGSEFWDTSLVDPDNRRPVDWQARTAALGDRRPIAALLDAPFDGRVKQRLAALLLNLRRAFPALFARGSYVPVGVRGALGEHAVAFARSLDGVTLLIAAPIRIGALPRVENAPVWRFDWGDTHLAAGDLGRAAIDVISGRAHPLDGLELDKALATFPVLLAIVAD